MLPCQCHIKNPQLGTLFYAALDQSCLVKCWKKFLNLSCFLIIFHYLKDYLVPFLSSFPRDRPFISVVRAPRVILLVNNEQPNKTRTHILFTTIANAWPMLVFILVTASLSGIIIWFLVSCLQFLRY